MYGDLPHTGFGALVLTVVALGMTFGGALLRFVARHR